MTESIIIKQAKLPILRKIFRRGHYFVCGICRTEYHNKTEANNCLNHCWYALKEQYPLITRKDITYGKLYRCQYCFRDYKTEDAGLVCANMCADKKEKKHVQEQLTNDLKIDIKPKRKFRLVKVVPNEDTSPQPHADAAQEQEIDNLEANQEANQEQEVVEQAVERRHKSSFDKNWIRDGAKYKCKFCHELYYTKVEVEQCFNGHFDDQGFEILDD